MERRRRKIILLILIAFCLFALGAGLLFVVPREDAAAQTYFGSKNVADLRSADPAEIAARSQYSGRDYGIVSTVKNQGGYSLCWAFATYAASEASILREGLAVQSPYFDLEERVLAYRAHNPVGDPFHLIDDDVTEGDGSWNKGGYVEAAGKTLLQWRGPTMQYYDTNDAAAVRREDYEIKYKLESMMTVKYSVDAVKLLVAEYGAAAFSFPIHTYSTGYYDIDTYFNNTGQSKANPHGCIIVGWDDTIPASKFKPRASTGDGGWIVKNSWGSERHDEGYFYLSYDSDIYDIWAFDYTKAEAFDNQYLYNGTIGRGSVSIYGEDDATARAAAIYCAQGGTSETREELTAVNVGIGGEDVTVNISVYTGLQPNYGNPSSPLNDPVCGEPVSTASAKVTRDGYYTFYLDKSVPLENGESFSVVVEATSGTEKKARILGTQDYFSTNDMTFEYKDGAWSNLKNYGNYCAHVRAYTRNVAREEEVSANDLQFARMTLDEHNFTYSGEMYMPKVTVTLGGKTLREGQDFELRYENNKNALGNAVAIAEGRGEYTGEARAHFYIAQAKEAPNKPVTSSQSPIVVGSEVTHLGQIPLPEGWEWCIDVDLTKYASDEPMGWAIKFPVTDGNYVPNVHDKETGEEYIQAGVYVKRESKSHMPAPITGAEVTGTGEYFYSGEYIVPEVVVKVNGCVLTRGLHYNVVSTAVDAGNATATVVGTFTFTGSQTFAFTIGKSQEPPRLVLPESIEKEEGMETLGDIALPEGWRWADETAPLALGTVGATCEYVGADADNYAVLTREVTFELIEKAALPDPDPEPEPDPKPDPEPDTGETGGGDTGDAGGGDTGGSDATDSADDTDGADKDGAKTDGSDGSGGGNDADKGDGADEEKAGGLSPAAIAGISVGGAAGVGLIALAVVLLRRRLF